MSNQDFVTLLGALKAVAEETRARILLALSKGELNVSELTYVLDQSQPRVSRHLKLMLEAELITRHKEGNWVLFRLAEGGIPGNIVKAILAMLPTNDPQLKVDLQRLQDVRTRRAETALAYFAANASNWESLRSLHIDEANVERKIVHMIGREPFDMLVDLGTGTGRMLELFASQAKRLIGVDLSREMLGYARANLDRLNAPHAQVRQASIYSLPLPDRSADVVILHQVLHFLDEPEAAIREAARILQPSGKLLIVDFAPHGLEDLREQNAHRRLGISFDQLSRWLRQAKLSETSQEVLPPPAKLKDRGLTVSLLLAQPIVDGKAISSTGEAA